MGNFPSAVAAPVVRTLRGDTAPNDHDGTSDRQTPYNVAASEAAGSVTGSSSDSPAPGDDDSNGTSGHPPLVLHAIPAATVEDVFISHAGLQKDCYGVHLSKRLRACGITTFLDERDIELGQEAVSRMKAACYNAKLAIFVITRSFLASPYCMDEVRWALDARGRNGSKLPEVMTVLYPEKLVRGFTRHELEKLSLDDKDAIIKRLTTECIEVDQLSDLSEDLQQQIMSHSPLQQQLPPQQQEQHQQEEIIFFEQRQTDLKTLAGICLQRPDACPRGDDLVLDKTVEAVERLLAPYNKLSEDTKTVGFEDRLLQVQAALSLDSSGRSPDTPIVVGVYGMGGVGKSTLAYEVYDAAATVKTFGRRRIYLSVGKDCKSPQELSSMRCKLLKKLSGASMAPTFDNFPMERRALKNALGAGGALLLVLDDLWEREQLHWLLACEAPASEDPEEAVAALPEGSRVLLTSRSGSVVTIGKRGNMCPLMKLDVLEAESARKLLQNSSSGSSLQMNAEQMEKALHICGGLPLALNVLGKQLADADTQDLQKVLDRFEGDSEEVDKMLRMSFMDLSDDHRLMFFDAALVLRQQPKAHLLALWEGALLNTGTIARRDEVKAVWEDRKRADAAERAERLLTHLCDLSLLAVTKDDVPRLEVHERFVELARRDGRSTHATWYSDSADETLEPEVTRIQCRLVDATQLEFKLLAQCLGKETHLQLLEANCHSDIGDSMHKDDEFARGLLYLRALTCPSMAKNMDALRVLVLMDSPIMELPVHIQALTSLQLLDLSACKSLRGLPESISALTGLRLLDLSQCEQLQEVPASIGALASMQHLNMSCCKTLRQLPDSIGALASLRQLDLSVCVALQQLPHHISTLANLQRLNLQQCKALRHLPGGIKFSQHKLPLQQWLSSRTEQLPGGIDGLNSLEELNLSDCTNLRQLPSSIDALSNLRRLNLHGCGFLRHVTERMGALTHLQHCDGEEYELLDLTGAQLLKRLPDTIRSLTDLQVLKLNRCRTLEQLPDGITSLGKLRILDLSCCHKLQQLPEGISSLVGLRQLLLPRCQSLQSLPSSIGDLTGLQHLDMSFCRSLVDLPRSMAGLTGLHHLDFSWCRLQRLQPINDSLTVNTSPSHLHSARTQHQRQSFRCIGALTNLHVLKLSGWQSKQPLPRHIPTMPSLRELNLISCRSMKALPNSITKLAGLQLLDMSECTRLEDVPDCISCLKSLQELRLMRCDALKRLPNSITALIDLRQLNLSGCATLSQLPTSIGTLSRLQLLDLSSCTSLQELPESVGDLTDLNRLDVSGCKLIKTLPLSIIGWYQTGKLRMEGLPVEMVSFPWSDLDELLVGSVAVAQRTASTTISAPEANYISQEMPTELVERMAGADWTVHPTHNTLERGRGQQASPRAKNSRGDWVVSNTIDSISEQDETMEPSVGRGNEAVIACLPPEAANDIAQEQAREREGTEDQGANPLKAASNCSRLSRTPLMLLSTIVAVCMAAYMGSSYLSGYGKRA